VLPTRYWRPPPPPPGDCDGDGGPNNSTCGPLLYRLVTTPPFGQPFGPQLTGTTDVATIDGGQAFDCGLPVAAAHPPHSASAKSDGSRRLGMPSSSPKRAAGKLDTGKTVDGPYYSRCQTPGGRSCALSHASPRALSSGSTGRPTLGLVPALRA
jgi:hypothetical protein